MFYEKSFNVYRIDTKNQSKLNILTDTVLALAPPPTQNLQVICGGDTNFFHSGRGDKWTGNTPFGEGWSGWTHTTRAYVCLTGDDRTGGGA